MKKTLRQLSRPIRHRLGSIFILLLSCLCTLLPLSVSQWLGMRLGLVLRILLRGQRSQVENQLFNVGAALKLKSPDEIYLIERAHWSDLGRRLGEWLAGEKALQLFKISDQCRSLLTMIKQRSSEGRPQVILTAHFGHWELMAAFLSSQGFKFTAIAAPPPRGPIGRWLTQHRTQLGIETIHPHGGAKIACQRLERGGIIALLIDQSTRERSVSSTFLGLKAPMSLTADRLIKRFSAEVHWVTCRYTPRGEYVLDVESLLPDINDLNVSLSEAPSLDGEELQYIRLAHRHLEAQIIAAPQQWIWFHRRWVDRRDQ